MTVHLADTVTHPHRHARAARALAVVSALIGVALLVAACGASPSPGVANTSSSRTSTSSSSASANGGSPSSGGGAPSTSSPGGGQARSGFAIAGGNRQNALKFSACMRANGEPSFPDPNASGVIQGSNIDPGSPGFQAAQKKCQKYRANGGQPSSSAQQAQAQTQALKFSACMRSHGLPKFPDPQFSSGGGVRISIRGGSGSGLDPNSPIYKSAQKACQSDLPGRIGQPSSSGGGG
jgi:hypothetical protein